ncbi:MAG: hypothetical protein DWQ37_22290 [Planctomycetota bacterium]|nr:MAG: hypothetical protein DWQ37_22290 [Planctomycetota bacterium]
MLALRTYSCRVPWLSLVLLFATLLSGCGSPMPPEHTKAVARFQELGGEVNLRDGGFEVNLRDTLVQDDDLASLGDIQDLKAIDLRGTEVTPAALDYIRPIKTLDVVLLKGTKIPVEEIIRFDQELGEVDVLH